MSTEQVQENVPNSELIRMTSSIVAAYLSNNPLPTSQISEIISVTHNALKQLNSGEANKPVEPQKPAISVRRSVTPEYIVCLEDGKKLKMLKRHLRTAYQMTPEEYRTKWGLPSDYPMVAPNYAAQRSEFAKKIGLGKGASKRGRKSR